jgi:hypothetical protein
MATREDFDKFWGRAEKAVPGMLDLGVGLYGRNAGAREANAKVNAAQGPVYQAATAGATGMLGRSMDPRAAAKERLDAEMGLLTGADEASETDLMRKLHARGMLGMGQYNPGVEGINPSGTAMNPQLAAYYAARNARNAKMASDSLDKGENAVTANINRANTLQGTADSAYRSGMTGQDARGSSALRNMEMLKKGVGVLKDSGMLGMGTDWLKKQMGGMFGPAGIGGDLAGMSGFDGFDLNDLKLDW